LAHSYTTPLLHSSRTHKALRSTSTPTANTAALRDTTYYLEGVSP
jgi:hypothetical protein